MIRNQSITKRLEKSNAGRKPCNQDCPFFRELERSCTARSVNEHITQHSYAYSTPYGKIDKYLAETFSMLTLPSMYYQAFRTGLTRKTEEPMEDYQNFSVHYR